MKKMQKDNVLNSSALSKLLNKLSMLLMCLVLLSSCAEESISTSSTPQELTKWYNIMLLDVTDDVEDSLGSSVVTFDQKAYCENTDRNIRDEFIPIAYLNIQLSKTVIEVESEDALPVKLTKSYTSSKTPYKSNTQLGEDVVEIFEFDDSQVATISYGIRYDFKVSEQDTLHIPHIKFDNVAFKKHTVVQDSQVTETEKPHKVTLEFDITYSDQNTTIAPKTYSVTASPWYKKVVTIEPTVVQSVEYDGFYQGYPVDAYEVTEIVTTNKGSFENFYRLPLQYSFNGPQKREQPTEDNSFNNVSTGKLSQSEFSETKNSDGFTLKTMTGTYTSSNSGTEHNTIVESVATFTYETPVKLETEYGTHQISPLNVKFEEKGFTIKELSSTEQFTTYQTINTIKPIIIVPDNGNHSLETIKEEVTLKQRVPTAPDIIKTDSTYVLKGNGDRYIVEKITHWSDNSTTTSTYEYEGTHSIAAIDFGQKITTSLNWEAKSLELTSSTTSKTEEKKFSNDTKFVVVYSNKTHSANASHNSETGTFSYKENSPTVTFIDGDIQKTFPSRGYQITDNGATLSSTYSEIIQNSVAYKAYEYNHSISAVWDNSNAESLVSKGMLLLTADQVGEPQYDAKQTWSGNTTTITVTKTIPHSHANDEVTTYKTSFTVYLEDLTNGALYADNTLFDLTEKLTNETSANTTDGYFTIYSRTRTYNYSLSNGDKTRNMPVTIKDAKIVFNDGSYSKSYDVYLTSSYSSSFDAAYENGEYMVTNHNLNISAKTVDNKTLTTSGTTKIYVKQPSQEPEFPHLGKPTGFTVTATFDPDSKVTRRAFCFNWEDGVTYAVCDYETMLPKSSDFHYKVDLYEGYNSVGYNKNNPSRWEPARGVDSSDFITWYSSIGDKISAIDKDITCKAIGWKNIVNGKYSLIIEGYTYTIDGYNITVVAPNGETVTFNSHYE